MSEPIRGTIDDPAFRRERARLGGLARASLDHHIDKLVQAVDRLTEDQRARLVTLTYAYVREDGGVPHLYVSTACQHAVSDCNAALHLYCKSHTGRSGAKHPARCKWCPSPCLCPCHTEELTA